MLTNRKIKKWILVLTGLVFIGYPAFDRYVAMNEEPFMFMYVIAVLIGLGYLGYGIKYK